jgi:hypothetical protein
MESVELPLKVVEKQQQTPTPEETQPEQEQPTDEQVSGIPAEYVTAAVFTVIVALIALVAYLFIRKRNRSSPVVISN